MQNTPPAVSTENQQIANQAASATNNLPMSSQTLTPSPGVSQRKFDRGKIHFNRIKVYNITKFSENRKYDVFRSKK